MGEFTFAGNKVVKTDGLRPLFKLEPGEWYNEKKIRKGLDKAREAYGSIGYFEFTGYPDLSFPGEPQDGAGENANAAGPPPPSPPAAATAGKPVAKLGEAPVVNVTLRMEGGEE